MFDMKFFKNLWIESLSTRYEYVDVAVDFGGTFNPAKKPKPESKL